MPECENDPPSPKHGTLSFCGHRVGGGKKHSKTCLQTFACPQIGNRYRQPRVARIGNAKKLTVKTFIPSIVNPSKPLAPALFWTLAFLPALFHLAWRNFPVTNPLVALGPV